MEASIQNKYQKLWPIFEEMGSVVVAFSAGVDSTLVLKVAHAVLGQKVLAATGLSETYAEEEMLEARALAHELQVEHLMVRTEELTDPRYAMNSEQRCYFCKDELYSRLRQLADERGIAFVVDGTNADDLADFRPGLRAAQKLGVRSPLQEAGLTKAEIREISQELGLRTWDKPAYACLSSRFPYGTAITPEKLAQIAESERFIRGLGFKGFRVRHFGLQARLEFNPADFGRVVELHQEIVQGLQAAGYSSVVLDLQGYRQGSLNREIKVKTLVNRH